MQGVGFALLYYIILPPRTELQKKKGRCFTLLYCIILPTPAKNLLQSFHSPLTHSQRFIFRTIYIFNPPNLRQEVSNFYMQPRFVQLDLSQLILLLPAVCKESLIKPHGFAETYSFKQPDWWNELNY